MKLKKNELASILQEVEEEIAGLLKNESEALAKAKEDEDGGDGGGEPEGSAPAEGGPEASASASPEGSDPAASAPPAGPEASAPAPEASAAAPDAPGPEGSDPAAAGPVDPEALKAEYMQLPPEELKAHYMAAKAALFELMGGQGGGAPGPEASAPAPAGPEASAPPAGGPPGGPPAPAMKAEVPASMKNNPANGGTKQDAVPGAIQKSESAEVAELNQKVELLTKAVDLALKRNIPERKAITGLSGVTFISKSEEQPPAAKEPSKADVKEKIRTAMASGKLNKSEKDLLFSYGMGNVGFDQIAGLLDKK